MRYATQSFAARQAWAKTYKPPDENGGEGPLCSRAFAVIVEGMDLEDNDLVTMVQDLAARVSVLEAAFAAQPGSVVSAAAPVQIVAPAGGEPPFVPPPPTVPFNQPPPPLVPAMPAPRREASFEWGIESVLRWAGIGLVTLAGIFLVSTAVTRGWIGPELQLLGAALVGVALLAGALWFVDERPEWSLALGCGGSIVLIVSSVATHEWLDLVGPGLAVGFVTVALLCAVAVAVWTRLEGIALVAALSAMFGAFGPLEDFGDAAILSWTAALVLAASGLGLARQWPGVRLITGWVGAFVLMAFAVTEDVQGSLQAAGFVGAAVVGAALWLAPIIANRLAPSVGSGTWGDFDWTPIDFRLVAVVPVWVWAVVAGLLSFDNGAHYGIVAVITAAGFMGLVELTFGRIDRTVSMATLLGAFSLLAVGFAVYFDGPALMVALVGHAATSYLLSRKLKDVPLQYASYLAGAAASLLALFEMADAINVDGFPNMGYAIATAIVVLCWVTAAVLVLQGRDPAIPFQPPFLGAWIGSLVWLAAALIGAPQGQVLISAAWTVMACAGLVIGLTKRRAVVKNAALGTLALTLAKLVTVDLAAVDVFWRVGLFFAIGTGLIVLGLKVPSLIAPESATAELPGDALAPEDVTGTTF